VDEGEIEGEMDQFLHRIRFSWFGASWFGVGGGASFMPPAAAENRASLELKA
jgi:hypothetical protein